MTERRLYKRCSCRSSEATMKLMEQARDMRDTEFELQRQELIAAEAKLAEGAADRMAASNKLEAIAADTVPRMGEDEVSAVHRLVWAELHERERSRRALAILQRTNPSGNRIDPQGMIDEAIAALRDEPEEKP